VIRTSTIAAALLATVAQYGALTVLAQHTAHAATLKCTDAHDPWTLVVSDGGTSASFWQDNVSNGGIRKGVYSVTEGYTVAKFNDGWIRLKDNAQGDFTFGSVSGTLTCQDTAKPAPTDARAAPLTPMTYGFSTVGARTMIYAKGEFALDEGKRFDAWRHALPQDQQALMRIGAVTVVLDSDGGIIGGAADLAAWVKANKVDTIVPKDATCASACVMVWGAGYRKAVSVEAHMGVHGSYSPETDPAKKASEEATGTLFMARALGEEKAPANVIAAVTMTDSKDMHWMVSADAVAWGAVILDKDGKPMDPAATQAAAPVWEVSAQ
jgi:ATP-dependent protease ClpP protease subunit